MKRIRMYRVSSAALARLLTSAVSAQTEPPADHDALFGIDKIWDVHIEVPNTGRPRFPHGRRRGGLSRRSGLVDADRSGRDGRADRERTRQAGSGVGSALVWWKPALGSWLQRELVFWLFQRGRRSTSLFGGGPRE